MAKITGPTDMLVPFQQDGTPNLFANDVILSLAAKKPITFSPDGTVATIHDLVDFERLSYAKAAQLFAASQGATEVTGMPGMIGVPIGEWNKDSIVMQMDNEGKPKAVKWDKLVDGKAYTYREADGKRWISEGAINPNGLTSKDITVLLDAAHQAAGYQLLTHAAYQATLPPVPMS